MTYLHVIAQWVGMRQVFMLPTRAGSGLAEALTEFLAAKAADGSLNGLLHKYRLL